jgi:hypothetical protein
LAITSKVNPPARSLLANTARFVVSRSATDLPVKGRVQSMPGLSCPTGQSVRWYDWPRPASANCGPTDQCG